MTLSVTQRIDALAKKFTFSHFLKDKNENEVYEFLRDYFFSPTFNLDNYNYDLFSKELYENLGYYSYMLTNDDICEVYDILKQYWSTKKQK
jgi:hypothetical protein